MKKLIRKELSYKRIQEIINRLDLYSRIYIGQYDEMLRMYSYSIYNEDNYLRHLFKNIRIKYIPTLKNYSMGASLGIWGPDTPLIAKRAYDIQQILRFQLSWHLYPQGGYTVNFDKPFIHGQWVTTINTRKKIQDIIKTFNYRDLYTLSGIYYGWDCPLIIESFNDMDNTAIVLMSKEVENIISDSDTYYTNLISYQIVESFRLLYPEHEKDDELSEYINDLEEYIKQEFQKDCSNE